MKDKKWVIITIGSILEIHENKKIAEERALYFSQILGAKVYITKIINEVQYGRN